MGVSVRHNSRLAAVVALVAAVMTVAWFARALQTGSISDWFWCVVVAAVGVLQLLVVRDGRAPLMLADEHGVRVRHGETWSGLRWQDIAHVDVQSPGSWLRDGRIVVVPRPVAAPDSSLDDESDASRPGRSTQAESFVVPLGDDHQGRGRRPDRRPGRRPRRPGQWPGPGARGDPDGAREGREGESPKAEKPRPRSPRSPEKAPRLSRAEKRAAREEAELARRPGAARPSSMPAELDAQLERGRRDRGCRATEPETAADRAGRARAADARARARVRPGRARSRDPARRAVRGLARVGAPVARPAHDPGPALLGRARSWWRASTTSGSSPVRAAENALIGPMIAAARNRARLSIDTLSERTRIRPHVLECIEVDDFEACGGDFYARGHLRTLARVFGLDPAGAARAVRRALRHRGDRGPPGLRGRARLRHRRGSARRPHRPALERPGRLRAGAGGDLGRRPGLQRPAPGAGQPGAERRRLGRPGQGRAGRAPQVDPGPDRGHRDRERARRSSSATATAGSSGRASSPTASASR